MNKQKLQGAFSKIHASDDLSRKVLSVEKDQKKVGFAWRPAVRVATAAALMVAILIGAVVFWPVEDSHEPGIIAVPGVMKVYACDSSAMDSIKLEDYQLIEGNEPSYKTAWSPYISLLTGGVTLTLVVDEESLSDCEITYDLSVNYGELYLGVFGDSSGECLDVSRCKAGVAKNGETISWTGHDLLGAIPTEKSFEDFLAEIQGVYLNVIIKADGKIIGYTVLEMVCTNVDLHLFQVALIDSCYFPKVEGKYQNISEEYVQELMNK